MLTVRSGPTVSEMPMMGSYAANKSHTGLQGSFQASGTSVFVTENYGKTCTKHSEEVNSIYCVRCKTGICVCCAIGEHRMHSILDVDGFTSSSSGKAVHDIEYLVDWVQVQLKDVVTLERNLVERYASYRSATNGWRDEVTSLVDARADSLISELKYQISSDREHIKQHEAELAARVSLLRRMKSAGQEQVGEKMGHEILSLIEKVESLHDYDTFSLIEVPMLANIISKTAIEEILECPRETEERYIYQSRENCPTMTDSSTQWDEDDLNENVNCQSDKTDQINSSTSSGNALNSPCQSQQILVDERTSKALPPQLPSSAVLSIHRPRFPAALLFPRSKSVDDSYRKDEMVAKFGCQSSRMIPSLEDMRSHGDYYPWKMNPPGHVLRPPTPPLSAIRGYGPPPIALFSPSNIGAKRVHSSVPAHITHLVKASSCPSINTDSAAPIRRPGDSGSGDSSPCPEEAHKAALRYSGIPLHSIQACIITKSGEERTVYSLDKPRYDEISDKASVSTADNSEGKVTYKQISSTAFHAVIHGIMGDPRYDQMLVKTSNDLLPINIYSCEGEFEQQFGVLDTYVHNTSGGICLDSKRGITLVVETPYSLLQFSSAGEYIGRINIYTAKELSGVAYCSGPDLYAVTDTVLGRVWLVHPGLATAISFFSSIGSEAQQLYMPEFIAYDPISDLLAVSDAGNDAVKLFDMDGNLVRIYGQDSMLLKSPGGVAFDKHGHVVVCDTGNYRVLRFWVEKHRERCVCLLDKDTLGGNHPWCLDMTSPDKVVVSTFSTDGTLPDRLCFFTASHNNLTNQPMDVDFYC